MAIPLRACAGACGDHVAACLTLGARGTTARSERPECYAADKHHQADKLPTVHPSFFKTDALGKSLFLGFGSVWSCFGLRTGLCLCMWTLSK